MMDPLLKEVLKFSAEQFLPEDIVKFFDTLFGTEARYFQDDDGDKPNPARTAALNEVKRKDGSVSLWIGTRETGKCIKNDTQLCLIDGSIIRAGNCKPGQIILAMSDDLKIVPTTILATYDMGHQKCFEVKTRTGRQITTTPEHAYYTINGWVPIVKLKVGDRIAVARKIPVESTGSLSDDKIKLLAYMLGDGSIGYETPSFTNADPLLISDINDCLKSFPGITMKPGSKYSYRLTGDRKHFRKNEIIEFFRECKIWGKNSKNKFIPDIIFTLPLPKIALFLNRLFATDGWVETKDICYCSTSHQMINQVQHLLLRFGILSHYFVKNGHLSDGRPYSSWILSTCGKEHAEKFIDKIGIFGKSVELDGLSVRLSLITSQGSWDTIPQEIWNTLIRRKNRWEPGFNWADFGRELGMAIPKNSRSSLLYAPSRGKVAVLAKVTSRDDLKYLASSDIYWDEIISVTETEADVCDLTTQEHNFIAADIIVHNSVGAYREAEFLGRPTYAVSPEEAPPYWITRVDLSQVPHLPHHITLILDDVPAWMSNKDYNKQQIIMLEKIVPMVRHERQWHLIFNTQSTSQADKYILDCELAFFKPWGILMDDAERPAVRRIYKTLVNPYFQGRTEHFIRTHALMKSRTYVGGIYIAKPDLHKEAALIAVPNKDGVYEVTPEQINEK